MACPSDETLRSLIGSADQETSAADAISHLAGCHECQDRVSSLQGRPKLDEILQAAEGNDVAYDAAAARVGPNETMTGCYEEDSLRTIGQYELIRMIGRGGGGDVFEARHTLLHRAVAVKVMTSRLAGNESARQRFLSEMKSIGQLDDPHIVRAYDAGEVDGTLYLAMELVHGENVESLARRVGRLPIADACEFVRQAAMGLQHVHQIGLVHRDLKPSNLLISEAGIKIADLGLALLSQGEPVDDRLTGEHTVLGTVDYMAPEQAEKSRDVDIRADIYSLGCTLFRLLAGRPPFAIAEYDTPMKKMWAHSSQPIPDILQLRPEIPRGLVAILQKLLAKDRDQRYAEPKQVAEALIPYCQSANYPILVIRSSPGSSISERNSTVRSATHRFLHGSITAKLPSWITQTLITKPRLKAAATATICAMIAVVSWGVSVAIPRGQPRSALLPTPPDERPVRVESDPPMPPTLRRWVDEFGFVPIDLRWPGRKGFGKGEIEEDLKSLVIQTQDCNRLVKLGEYSASDRGFTVALDVSPQSSEGEFGIFFGFQSEKDDRPKLWQYQVIQLQVRSSRQVPSLRVSRYLAKLKSENQPIAGYHNQSMDMELPHPLRIRMEVQVEHNRLTSVTICGQQCDPLSIVTLNDQYSDSDYFGGFGVFAENATVWFSNPKFVRRN